MREAAIKRLNEALVWHIGWNRVSFGRDGGAGQVARWQAARTSWAVGRRPATMSLVRRTSRRPGRHLCAPAVMTVGSKIYCTFRT